jgi:TPR repeat protein
MQRASFRRWILVAAVSLGAGAGCGHRPDPAGDPAAPRPGARRDAAALTAEANALVQASQTLDYRAPRQRDARRGALERAIALYLEACRAGDRPSCWKAAAIPGGGVVEELDDVLARAGDHCLAGDEASCRAVGDARVVGRGGWSGDAREAAVDLCDRGLGSFCGVVGTSALTRDADRARWFERGCDHGHGDTCDRLRQQAETEGWPAEALAAIRERTRQVRAARCDQDTTRDCQVLANHGEVPWTRVAELAAAGCALGLVGECDILHVSDVEPALRERGLAAVCAARGVGCDALVAMRSEPIGVRDALEHGCQLGDDRLCLELIQRYRRDELPEPVTGRAADLVEHLCAQPAERQACRELRP